jgi:hypothetical protein
MKPADDPRFFQLAPPDGQSRESDIRLSADGELFHEGERVAHPNLARALHTWIGRHPTDGRYILSNGHDWVYFTVDDAPFQVLQLRQEGSQLILALSDGSEEPWDPAASWIGADDAVYARVKAGAPHGPFVAKLSRRAQQALSPYLRENQGGWVVQVGDRATALGRTPPR